MTPDTGIDSACRTMVPMRLRRRVSPRLPLLGATGLVLALATALAAPPAAASVDPVVDALITKRLDNPRLGGNVALLAVDAATGEVVSDRGSGRLMLPASNMKIVTAVTALAALGPQARFTTKVRAGATPADIVLEGGGDPLLSTTDLRRLANATAKALPAGVPVVVHVDDDLFPDTRRAPGWTRSYIPSVVSSVEALARLWDYSPDPSANAVKVFVQRLQRKGIPATIGPDADAGEGAVIAEAKGHTVDQALRVMLRISENNVAEVMYRQVARAAGFEATWDGSRQAAEQVLRNVGVDPTGMSLLDGSGLSRKDRVSPRFLVDVLRVTRTLNPAPFALMFESDAMPVSGVSGTLDDRYGRFVTRQSRCAQGEVRAKTGTLFDTIGLSGVATTVSGPERIFAILVNDRPQRFSALSTRQAVDGLSATLTGCWD
jgi:D-alanyl-D-alanine carboxypeptidase/D-alanyl-D-alanine-endopeptidase (penicillin-binding protein 4)